AVDAAVGNFRNRGRLLQDGARLEAHAGRGPHRDEQRGEPDEAAYQPAEESAHAVTDEQHDRKDVDPGHLPCSPQKNPTNSEPSAANSRGPLLAGTRARAESAPGFTLGTWRGVFSPAPA